MTSKEAGFDPDRGEEGTGLCTKSRVAFVPTEAESCALAPATRTVRALKRAITGPGEAVSLDQMDEAVADGAMESLH